MGFFILNKSTRKLCKEGRLSTLAITIGDGSITKDGRIYIRHSENQLDYLNWKIDLLKSHGMEFGKISKDSRVTFGKYHTSYSYRSKTYPFLKKYRKAIYTPTKNIYTDSVLNHLTDKHIAIWFMDDGCLSNAHNKNNNIFGRLYTFTSYNVSLKIADFFKNRLNDDNIRIFQKKNSCQKFISDEHYNLESSYCIRFNKSAMYKLIDIITPTVLEIPSMYYKINLTNSKDNDELSPSA